MHILMYMEQIKEKREKKLSWGYIGHSKWQYKGPKYTIVPYVSKSYMARDRFISGSESEPSELKLDMHAC